MRWRVKPRAALKESEGKIDGAPRTPSAGASGSLCVRTLSQPADFICSQNRRHLRPILGLAFTSELALARLSHKDFVRCGGLPYLPSLEPARACPMEAPVFPEALPSVELGRDAAGPVFLHVGCVYRKLKHGRSGDEVRPGWRLN